MILLSVVFSVFFLFSLFVFLYIFFFFFFQAEDGIRDIGVTGVQTCALPISHECKGRIEDCAPCVLEIADPYSQDAWRAILDPALAFMREKSCGEAVKLA